MYQSFTARKAPPPLNTQHSGGNNLRLFGRHNVVVESGSFFSCICRCSEETLSLGAQVFKYLGIFAGAGVLFFAHRAFWVVSWRFFDGGVVGRTWRALGTLVPGRRGNKENVRHSLYFPRSSRRAPAKLGAVSQH